MASESVSRDSAANILSLMRAFAPDLETQAIRPLRRGGNNRTYHVITSAGEYLAKEYFTHPGDRRNRLETEFDFTVFAHTQVGTSVPRPWHCDRETGIAIYEFVTGKELTPGDLREREVDQASSLFNALNTERARVAAKQLPLASEAVFSIADHVELVGRRIERLEGIGDCDGEDRAARRFVTEIRTRWPLHVDRLLKSVRCAGGDPNEEIAITDRCVSPSDFGFHNALKRSDGRLCFIDFEYAGWDDPARMICDFLCQPAVPVTGHLARRFVDSCLGGMPDAARWHRRAVDLWGIYAFKWCCIALAVFLPVSRARREFANPKLDLRQSKAIQLEKARKIFQSIEVMPHGLH